MRFRFLSHTLTLLCGGALLSACSLPVLHQERLVSTARADDDYARGRRLHLSRHYDKAIAAYEAALKTDAAHINAHNGLAVAYAEQHDLDRAIAIWRVLTRDVTTAAHPDSAFLFVNLGYAHYLKGDYQAALVALETACVLDPFDGYALQYLGETLQRLGREERARQVLGKASMLRERGRGRVQAMAKDRSDVATVSNQAGQAERERNQEGAFVEITSTASGLLELRRVIPARGLPGSTPVVATAPIAVKPIRAIRVARPRAAVLEILQGRASRDLAQRVSRQVIRSRRDLGVQVVRLVSTKSEDLAQTRIEYQPGYRNAARRLARRLGIGQPVKAGRNASAGMRLVIGRDLAKRAAAPRLVAAAVKRRPDAVALQGRAMLVSQR